MNDYECYEVKGKQLEFISSSHTYIYNGIILPSITQMLQVKFGKKYDGIPKEILKRASLQGIAVHKAIEEFEQKSIESELPELRNYKFLKNAYKFECVENEVPVVLFQNDEAVACGRLDLVLKEGEKIGLGDIKRTSTLDKNYLAYQLNLYRIAYQQSYGTQIDFLRGIHLRNDTRKYISLPINEGIVDEILTEFKGEINNEH